MKIKILKPSFLIIFSFIISLSLLGQNNNKEKPYSLEKDKEMQRFVAEQYKVNIDNAMMENIIKDLLSEKDEIKRSRAIHYLGKAYDNTEQIPVLEDLLINDPSNEVRAKCAEALKYLESYNSKNVLIKALNDSDRRVKLESALALAALGEKNLSFKALSDIFISANARDKASCLQGFRDINTKDAIDFLYLSTNCDTLYTAAYASVILAQLKYFDYAFPKLKGFSTNDDRNVRAYALNGLAYIGDKKSFKLIKHFLNDEDRIIREHAQKILDKYSEYK